MSGQGITPGDMYAYQELNNGLVDPYPEDSFRGPECHPELIKFSISVHGHLGDAGRLSINTNIPVKQ